MDTPTFRTAVLEQPEYLWLQIAGPVTRAHCSSLVHRLAEESASRECSRVLVDATGLQGRLSKLDAIDIGVEAARLLDASVKVAVVGRPGRTDGFGENVAVTRGGNVKVFYNEIDAVVWLLKRVAAPRPGLALADA